MKKSKYIIILACFFIILSICFKNYYSPSKLQNQNSYSESANTTPNIERISTDINITTENDLKNNRKREIKEQINKYGENINGIPVLMYHFFYSTALGENGKDNNHIEISKFEQHLKYLKDNDFFFPTFEELELFIDGKLELPSRSIILTVDDGDVSFFRLAIPLIEKYQVPVTAFIITNECSYNINEYKSNCVHFESHSNDMHKAGKNGKGLLVNYDYYKAYEDIQISIKILNSHNAFCYPFGHYNDVSEKAVKDSKFRVAFTTKGGRVKRRHG